RELDDPSDERCEHCANCAGPFVSAEVDDGLVREATHFLKRSYQPIEPRKRWPPGLGDGDLRGGIPENRRLEEGRALAIYGDAGWGRLVRRGKQGTGGFDEELVEAVAEMIEEEWAPDPFPTWVTAVPSLRHPTLVPGFAEALAGRLGLPYRTALEKQRETAPQKTMENSVQQARNAIGAFAALPGEVSADPVFLVDDMVDSRWSLTVCGSALLEAGSGPVFPVVLGKTTKGSD
ncbi:MAG TPA: hypothetical protein VG816_14565, partial [Solirubrobacterales bacterium]|nr:hypothetical protein [Solirubrobacterales bacterium]